MKVTTTPTYVGMQYQLLKDRVTELGPKLAARLGDEEGEIASWLVFMVALAGIVAAVVAAINTWATGKVGQLP